MTPSGGFRMPPADEWTWIYHHDNLLHTRTGFWLGAQSLGFSIIAAGADGVLAVVACCLGLVLAGIWWRTSDNLGSKLAAWRRLVDPADRWIQHWNTLSPKPKHNRTMFGSFWLIVHGTPLVFAIAWIALGVALVLGENRDKPWSGSAAGPTLVP